MLQVPDVLSPSQSSSAPEKARNCAVACQESTDTLSSWKLWTSLDCGVKWSLFEGPVDPRVKLKGEVCSVKCWVSLEFTDTFTCVSCRQWRLKLRRSETSWTHWPKRSAMSGACTSQDFPGPPCLACLVCLAKLLTAVRSLPFHSHKSWQLHHCWYMIRWDRGCFGGWFTLRQWRLTVFPEVTCMNACSTFPSWRARKTDTGAPLSFGTTQEQF